MVKVLQEIDSTQIYAGSIRDPAHPGKIIQKELRKMPEAQINGAKNGTQNAVDSPLTFPLYHCIRACGSD